MTFHKVKQCYISWIAHADNGDDYYIVEKMNDFYKSKGGKYLYED